MERLTAEMQRFTQGMLFESLEEADRPGPLRAVDWLPNRSYDGSTPTGPARTLPGCPFRGHRSFHLVESQLAASGELSAGPGNDPQELRMLAQRQRLSINVPKRDDCRDCTISLRQHEDLVPQVGGIVGERTPSRCQVDALHSRTSSPPIVKMLLCFRPTARILTGPFASGPTS